MTESADANAPIYVDTFRIDVGRNGIALITFGSPVIGFETTGAGKIRLTPTVRVALTEEKLAELASLLGERVQRSGVLKLRKEPVS